MSDFSSPAAAGTATASEDFIPDIDGDEDVSLVDAVRYLVDRWKLMVFAPLTFGVLALGATYLTAPTFTASTTLLLQQQSQGNAAGALASLGSLPALIGGASAFKSNGELYVALLQSATVSDRIIDQFQLMQVYKDDLRIDARKDLAGNVRFSIGKKDGLITIEVDDKLPARAADIANRYVEELRRMTSTLAVTEAQQRRLFFEQQLKRSRERLDLAQQNLQESGFSGSAVKAEPKATAEAYARLKEAATAAEIKLRGLRGGLTDDSFEVRNGQATLTALRDQLSRFERAGAAPEIGADYITRYRNFKYEETLFELYARQFELARTDEGRDGGLIQVVDPATPPEKKSKPKRGVTAIAVTMASGILLAIVLLIRRTWRSSAAPRARPSARS